MTLSEIITSIKSENLSQSQLESYATEIATLLAECELKRAELKREESMFMAGLKDGQSIASRKVEWKRTPAGLDLIKIEGDISAIKPIKDNVRSQLFSKFY